MSVFLRIMLPVCLTVLPYVLGKGLLAVLYGRRERELQIADNLLTGWIVCIGLAEAAHLAAVFSGQSFSNAVRLFGAGIAFVTVLAVAVLLFGRFVEQKEANKANKKYKANKPAGKDSVFSTAQVVLFLLFLLVVAYQWMSINVSGNVYRKGDMTVETVASFLRSDAIYRINPLTGRAYTEGIPLRLKILCLPTLYGAISKAFGLPVEQVVWNVIPTVVLAGSYLAYYLLAVALFPGEKAKEKRMVFLLFVALLFCVGDYQFGMDGFGVLYGGFRGVTIRNAVLLPYTFGLILRRRYRSVALCVLAEVCIVWTLYGAGACLLVFAVLGAVLSYKKTAREGKAGKGADV